MSIRRLTPTAGGLAALLIVLFSAALPASAKDGVGDECTVTASLSSGPTPNPAAVQETVNASLTAGHDDPTVNSECTISGPDWSWSVVQVEYKSPCPNSAWETSGYSPSIDPLSQTSPDAMLHASFPKPGKWRITVKVTGTWTGSKVDPECESCPACGNCSDGDELTLPVIEVTGSIQMEDCGGIKNGTLTRSRTWAHAIRTNWQNSQAITITPVGWVDHDCDCANSPNYWNAGATGYKAIGGNFPGFCTPMVGTSTEWKPVKYGDNYQVKVTLKDVPAPLAYYDDPDRVEYVDVNAFEVKVEMQVIDNSGSGHGTVIKTMWEYETFDPAKHSIDWDNLDCGKRASKWYGLNQNLNLEDTDNIHIDYIYKTVPGAADLYGGNVMASLATDSSTTLTIENVEDADGIDGSTDISLGVSAGTPVGFSIGTTITIGSDCAEAFATAAWGYSSTAG